MIQINIEEHIYLPDWPKKILCDKSSEEALCQNLDKNNGQSFNTDRFFMMAIKDFVASFFYDYNMYLVFVSLLATTAGHIKF